MHVVARRATPAVDQQRTGQRGHGGQRRREPHASGVGDRAVKVQVAVLLAPIQPPEVVVALDDPTEPVVLDAGEGEPSSFTIRSDTPGFAAEIRAGESAEGPFERVVSPSQTAAAETTWELEDGGARYYAVWITDMAPGSAVRTCAALRAVAGPIEWDVCVIEVWGPWTCDTVKRRVDHPLEVILALPPPPDSP